MYTEDHIRALLDQVASADVSVDAAVSRLRALPFEQVGQAMLDHHRHLRDGLGEVVYCEGKSCTQVTDIVSRLAAVGSRVLGTRASVEQYEAAKQSTSDLQYDTDARVLWLDREPRDEAQKYDGVVIVTAGTSDVPVAQEAVLTLQLMGHAPQCIYDVGVAGLHRLLHHVDALQSANVIVAVAGMEGALPSVVGGLVSAPVIAVPTSVGYGTSMNGLAALLGMLNTCAAGIAVVNIDNGFGAGYMAGMINRKVCEGDSGKTHA